MLKASVGSVIKDDLEKWNLKTTAQARQHLNRIVTKYKIDLLRDNQPQSQRKISVYKDAIVLGHILGYQIDLDKCNVVMWIEYNKLAKELQNERNKKK